MHTDAELSTNIRKYFNKKNVKLQISPPGNHRALKAERSIQTVKNHFIAGLCTADPNYELQDWDQLAEQAELTLNLLRGSALNPSISAWHQIHGPFDWSSTPLAPAGTKVVIHDRPNERASWAPHGDDGYYIGPALDHYRCYKVLVTKTHAIRTTDTVECNARR